MEQQKSLLLGFIECGMRACIKVVYGMSGARDFGDFGVPRDDYDVAV